MLYSDFKKHHIKNFTPNELIGTGAKLSDVKVQTIIALQLYRTLIKKRIRLIHNGITTGKHSAVQHPNGEAVDFFHDQRDGEVVIPNCVTFAVQSGFNGIGIYYNRETSLHSFHFDTRKYFTPWIGMKLKRKHDWKYDSALKDPQIELNYMEEIRRLTQRS